MTKENRNALLVAGFVLVIFFLLWRVMRNMAGVGEMIQGAESFFPFSFVFDTPDFASLATPRTALPIPQLDTGDKCCGVCSSKVLPSYGGQSNVAISWGPPPMSPEIAQFIAPQIATRTLSTSCGWNASGYLSRNPDVRDAFGTAGELKFRKKRKYAGTVEAWALFHYNEWGRAEGRKWDC